MKAVWQRCVQHRPSPSFLEIGIRYAAELSSSTGIYKALHISKSRDVDCLGRSRRRGRHVTFDWSAWMLDRVWIIFQMSSQIDTKPQPVFTPICACPAINALYLRSAHKTPETSTNPIYQPYAEFGRHMRRFADLGTCRGTIHQYKPGRMSKQIVPCIIWPAAWKCCCAVWYLSIWNMYLIVASANISKMWLRFVTFVTRGCSISWQCTTLPAVKESKS